jgi:hypothetical protein
MEQYIDRLGNDLVVAIARRRRQQLRVQRAAAAVGAAVAVALIAGLLVPGLPGGSPHTALAITSDEGAVTVRVLDAMADPTRMTAELQAAGVDARVQAEPTEPVAVGRWLSVGTVGPATPEASMAAVRGLVDQLKAHPDFLTIQKGLPVTLSLVVGRPTAAGEIPCADAHAVVIELDGGACPRNLRGPADPGGRG